MVYNRKGYSKFELRCNHGNGFELVAEELLFKEVMEILNFFREKYPLASYQIVEKYVKIEE